MKAAGRGGGGVRAGKSRGPDGELPGPLGLEWERRQRGDIKIVGPQGLPSGRKLQGG